METVLDMVAAKVREASAELAERPSAVRGETEQTATEWKMFTDYVALLGAHRHHEYLPLLPLLTKQESAQR